MDAADLPYDSRKDEANVSRHGISLARYVDLDIRTVQPDARYAYGEERYRAWGYIDGAAHCLAFTIRDGAVRPISLRRAHDKEMKRYAP